MSRHCFRGLTAPHRPTAVDPPSGSDFPHCKGRYRSPLANIARNWAAMAMADPWSHHLSEIAYVSTTWPMAIPPLPPPQLGLIDRRRPISSPTICAPGLASQRKADEDAARFDDDSVAAAMIDRFVYHAEIINIASSAELSKSSQLCTMMPSAVTQFCVYTLLFKHVIGIESTTVSSTSIDTTLDSRRATK